ncbi:MAG: nucleotidyltransferase domain-containing protein [Promethearchaeota archaeon]|jgi:predicted nucleotidyltransferase
MTKPAEIFKKLCSEAEEDPNIVGFFLGGSRGKGFQTKYSDYDVYIIVNDNVVMEYKTRYPKHKFEGLDLMVFSYSEFKNYASWGSSEVWDRYTFSHVKAQIDKNGKIQEILDEKGKIPEKFLSKFIAGSLDAYINYHYRSLKCIRDGNIEAARLEAAFSIPFFLNVVFAIHNGRLNPYYKYLKWELESFPLSKIPMSVKEIVDSLMRILDNADYNTQQKLLSITEKVLRKEGFGDVFESWGNDFPWMKNFIPKKE